MKPQTGKHVCQVAFTALDAAGLREWYANVFGLVRSGKILFFPPSTERVQGVPGAWEKTSWLLDQQDYFQLEFFSFLSPRTRLRPADWRPCDIGYNMVGIAVSDFDQVLRNVGAFSGIQPPPVSGEAGERRAVVADPEGNLVEILERDPITRVEGMNTTIVRPEVPAVVRTMRAVVPSLAEAREDFVGAMGLEVVEGFQLHDASDEALWGLEGAEAETLVLRSDNFLLELVQYSSPESRPWPEGYRLSDQGFMNIALGYRDNRDYDASFDRATRNGMTPNGKVADIGVFRVMYVNGSNGFSVEMLNARRFLWWVSGFSSHEPYVQCETWIRAPAGEVWSRLTDHAGLGDWSLFTGRVLRQGREQPNGMGCIRELTAAGMRITEEVTAWEEGAHYSYQLRTGAPFSKHQGDVFVFEQDGVTRVRWAVRFESWIPFTGRITAWLLQRVFTRALESLKRQLER
ncbi:MAG: SRPBCC family protein [Halieaceae bacterium]|nr:SRPBCC family protein [Halieaceae bacterium]MCP5165107.1 SRPBCC family protein [Pseudomonadales bacterium]MCP5202706.1 SRPBCC family protein [Pseudomonadales bacterium]